MTIEWSLEIDFIMNIKLVKHDLTSAKIILIVEKAK